VGYVQRAARHAAADRPTLTTITTSVQTNLAKGRVANRRRTRRYTAVRNLLYTHFVSASTRRMHSSAARAGAGEQCAASTANCKRLSGVYYNAIGYSKENLKIHTVSPSLPSSLPSLSFPSSLPTPPLLFHSFTFNDAHINFNDHNSCNITR